MWDVHIRHLSPVSVCACHKTYDLYMCAIGWLLVIPYSGIMHMVAPLIEGLCVQILYLRFEIIGGLRWHLLLFLVEKKTNVEENKHWVKDLILPFSIYIQMCTLHTYTNTYMPRVSPSGFFGPSRCLIPTPGLTPEYPYEVVFRETICVLRTHLQRTTLWSCTCKHSW